MGQQQVDAFSVVPRSTSTTTTRLHILPPHGSGYATDEDAQSHFPDSYDPMLEYPYVLVLSTDLFCCSRTRMNDVR